MAPKASGVWQWLIKATETSVAGNQKASCKGCGKSCTISPQQWWQHLLQCDGSNDEETAQHAKAAADKHFRNTVAAAARQSNLASSRFMQTSVVKLNQKQLNEQADEAIARWAFATGQPLRSVDDFYLRKAFNKVAAAGSSRKHVGRKRLKEQLLPAEKKRVKRQQQAVVDLNKELYGQSIVSDGWQDAN
jgi:hypothetical protein